MEQFTFFWGGPFSQWYLSTFVVDGITYNCAEQYMMAEKARLFNDFETLAKIMAEKNPRKQKALGREVKGFDVEKWKPVARDIVYKGGEAKFSQNPDLKLVLANTTGTTLVEASPNDDIWGIGLAEGDPRTLSRDTWLGSNWLGEALTKLRINMFGA